MTEISFQLNGAKVKSNAQPHTPLSDVLRDDLGMRSVKIGCGAGDCGACTVSMDGCQACACLVPCAQAGSAQVVTAESNDPLLQKLRDAFLAYGAAQCGICTPGMLMAAYCYLCEDGRNDRTAIQDALGGVLCRCTGYIKIIDAVIAVATNAKLTTQSAHAGEAVGARLARVDGAEKVNGTAVFAADAPPEGALWLRAIRSPYARARFELDNLQQWLSTQQGIDRVLTAADVPGRNGFGVYPDMKDQPVFADTEARYRGQVVLALVGEKQAVEAVTADQLPIRWTELAPIESPSQALAGELPTVQAAYPDNILSRGYLESGEPNPKEVAASVEARLTTAAVEHAYIEPEAGYAERQGDNITVFGCTQAPYMDRDDVAGVLGIPLEAVRVVPSACGGGFGGKLDVSFQPLVAVAAWLTGKPVQMVFSRTESMASSTKRHPAKMHASASADSSGSLMSFELDCDFDTGAYSSWGPTVAGRVPVHASGPYRQQQVRISTRAVLTNNPPSGAFRGFGTPQTAAARELMLDQLADKLGMDRLAIRLHNSLRMGDTTPSGQVLEASVGLRQCLQYLQPAWQQALARADSYNASDSRTRRGVGIACMWYGCGNTALSNPSSMRVRLFDDGRLVLFNGAVDIGQGAATVMRQICADALGLPIARMTQVDGDTQLTDDAGKSSASRQTFVSGRAAQLAGEHLRQQMLALLGAAEGAQLKLSSTELQAWSGDELIGCHRFSGGSEQLLEGHGYYDPPTTTLDARGQGTPYATYAFAAQICELQVNIRTGQVKVDRLHAAHDLGKTINPTLAEGQIEGGIAQGLGMALMEEYLPGRTENLHDYLIPTIGDMPEIDIALIESPEPEGPYGAKGLGEPALVPTPAAILSAIRHATGVVVERMPVLPHRLLEALQAQQQEAPK